MRPSRNQSLIEALGVEIKVRRLELGLSQEDLAGRCELDRPYITLIESGASLAMAFFTKRLKLATILA